MQIAKATSVLTHRGKVMAPHLLRATLDSNQGFAEQINEPIEGYPPITGVNKKYWDIALTGMNLVNHGKKGTARRAFKNLGYRSGGKSGTAQVFGLKEDEEYKAEELAEYLHDHALFTGFAPFEHPQVVATIVLENAGGGSTNGAPVVRKIFDKVLLNKEVVPE
jgi:penicillin-binding protein 2